jgi:plasmid stabilization system protein ParE
VNYRVEITAGAKREADAAYEWLAERTSHAAAWFNGLVDAIEGLAEFPTRWGLARESKEFDEPIRQLLYGKKPHVYRVLFIVRTNVVYVLHVRHGARAAMKPGDIALPPEGDSPH